MTNGENARAPKIRARLIEERGCVCLRCGWNLSITNEDGKKIYGGEFAHLKPTKLSKSKGRGRKERYYDIKKNPSAYAYMCEGCHDYLDEDPVEFIATLTPEQVKRFIKTLDGDIRGAYS